MKNELHIAFGLLVYLLLAFFNILPASIPLAVLVAAVSGIVDVDHLVQLVRAIRRKELKSSALEFLHDGRMRTPCTHSLLSLVIFFTAGFLISPLAGVGIAIAQASHIALDLLEKQGAPIFWPFTRKRPVGFIDINSRSMKIAFWVILALDFLLACAVFAL